MENHIPVIISILGAVVSIAVAWGRSSAEAEENKRWRAAMEKQIESCPTKENCALKHGFIEQKLTEFKNDLNEIKHLLMRMAGGKE